MDYVEVLDTSWEMVWRYKILILLGLMAGCTSSSGRRYDDDSSGISNLLSDLSGGMLFVLIILSLALLILLYVISVYGSTGLVRGAWQADEGSLRLDFTELLSGSQPYFWRIFTMMILLKIVHFGFWIFIELFKSSYVCALPLLCLSLPLIFILNILFNMTFVSVIGENLGLVEAFKRAYHLLQDQKKPVLWMGFILTGVELIFLVISFVVLLFFAMFFVFGETFSVDISALAVGLICLFLPVFAVIYSFFKAYIHVAWTLTFRRLALKPAEGAMVVEVVNP